MTNAVAHGTCALDCDSDIGYEAGGVTGAGDHCLRAPSCDFNSGRGGRNVEGKGGRMLWVRNGHREENGY